jgi:hypothetical protein
LIAQPGQLLTLRGTRYLCVGPLSDDHAKQLKQRESIAVYRDLKRKLRKGKP